MRPSIAIVVPILNEVDSLPQLLSGLGDQTLQPTELIFVDTGSTDGSQELLRQWSITSDWTKERFRILDLPGGLPGGGRNAGINTAKSDWIAFIDGGIVPEPDWLEQLADPALREGAKAMFGYCHFEADRAFPRAICALTYGYRASHPVLPASIFHRDTLALIGPFREDLRSAEDLLWTRRFSQLFGPRPTCQRARVHYRHFPESIRSTFSKWRRNERNSVRAGVRTQQHFFYSIGLPVVWLAPIFYPLGGGLLILGYLLLRGIIDPMRRSAACYWWKGQPTAFFIAVGMSALIDIAKWTGIVEGVIERVRDVTKKNFSFSKRRSPL